MFKSIHGTAPAYLCNEIVMNLNGYDTRGTDDKNIYLPKSKKHINKNIFFIYRGQVWNCLPDAVKSIQFYNKLNTVTSCKRVLVIYECNAIVYMYPSFATERQIIKYQFHVYKL